MPAITIEKPLDYFSMSVNVRHAKLKVKVSLYIADNSLDAIGPTWCNAKDFLFHLARSNASSNTSARSLVPSRCITSSSSFEHLMLINRLGHLSGLRPAPLRLPPRLLFLFISSTTRAWAFSTI
jgi:hypothetical protein